MSNNGKKLRISKRAFAVALALLVATHVLMGVTLIAMSKKDIRNQIEQRMLDIANTAAYQLDGDELKTLTPDDKGTEKYEKALNTLCSFQENIQLDYIYAIRAEDNGTFTFLIDPDKDDPGAFGELIDTTEALQNAAKGKADVDKVACTDDWGRFYSAYSPVFDSDGNVVAIVGVDFNADWFDDMLASHKAVVIVLTMIVLTIGIVLALVIHTSGIELEKNKYREKLKETLQREHEQEQELGSAMHLAYTDSMTGVKNKHAYLEAVEHYDAQIAEGTIEEFGVIVFDLNGLKKINDTLGHEEGDKYIKNGCSLICKKFCHSPVFRIGGDEFVVLLEGSDYHDRDLLLDSFDNQVEQNQKNGSVVISTGMEIFNKERDKNYSSVFERADKKMYKRKYILKNLNKLLAD